MIIKLGKKEFKYTTIEVHEYKEKREKTMNKHDWLNHTKPNES
jgi:hypothetical protein